MATLPPASTISSSHLDEAVSRAPLLSAPLQKQRLPISHSKQNASFFICEKSSAWRISAMAASAPQKSISFGTVEAQTLVGEEQVEVGATVRESSLFDWNSQWYPVSLIDDLDKRVPTAITVLGRHLVVFWDKTKQSWLVRDDIGPEKHTPLSDSQFNGRRVSQSAQSPESRSQYVQAVVYPSVEQDGLLWFWPAVRSEFDDVAIRKPPPSLPAYTDPSFKDKLHAMNLPYGYKKLIENLLEPAYVPFAHDEPQEDFLQDFENRINSAVGNSLKNSNAVCANKAAKQKEHGLTKINGSAEELPNVASKTLKAVKKGKMNPSLDLSFAVAQNGSTRKTNGSANASSKLLRTRAQSGTSGSSTSDYSLMNGTVIAKEDVPDGSSRFLNGRPQVAEHLDYAVKSDIENMKLRKSDAAAQGNADEKSKRETFRKSEGGLKSGKGSIGLLEHQYRKDIHGSDRENPASTNTNSRSDTYAASSHSSVVVKKPITPPMPLSQEQVRDMTDILNLPISSEGTLTDDMSKVSTARGLDLKSGMQALQLLIAQKEFALAKGLLKELYEEHPRNTDVLMEYAYVEKQLGDLVVAGSLYSQAISAYEDQENLGYDYVRALQALGSIEARARNARRARVLFMESIRAARQAEQYFPHLISGASVYGLHAWSRLEEQLGNWGKARELLARAAEIQPGNAVVHQSRALLEAKADNVEEARHHFSLAVDSAPRDVKCWHAWAIFEASQGNHEKMRELFKRALDVDPRSDYCLQAWAHQETLIGTQESKEKARSLFQKCIEIEPKSLFAWQAWAVMEKNLGNYDKAQELFEKCLEISPSSVACLQAYANMERYCKNWEAARKLLWKALKLEPENAAVLMELAFIENSLGNSEVAERLFALAGMVDKRKSRVKKRILASRLEVLESEAEKGQQASVETGHKSTESLKASAEAVKPKEKQLSPGQLRERQPILQSSTVRQPIAQNLMERQPLSQLQQVDANNHANFQTIVDAIEAKQSDCKGKMDAERRPSSHVKPTGSKPTNNFQVAIDAIRAKQKELRSPFKVERRYVKREERKPSTNFQAVIEAIELRQRELNKDAERMDEMSVYLPLAEQAPSMLGA